MERAISDTFVRMTFSCGPQIQTSDDIWALVSLTFSLFKRLPIDISIICQLVFFCSRKTRTKRGS